MEIRSNKNLVIILTIISLMACNGPLGKNRYSGYENVIKVDSIKSLSATHVDGIVDILIPPLDSITFDYNRNLEDIKFIKLETKPDCKIVKVDKILLSKDRIILVELNPAKVVYVFDSSGKFINSIRTSSITNKKAMISNFIDVTFDYGSEEIVLHDQSKSKSYHFDKDGNFKNNTREYIYFVAFTNLRNSDNYVYINPFGANRHIPALKGSAVYFGKKNTKIEYTSKDAIENMTTDADFQINNNLSLTNSNKNVFYTPEFSDTVYKIDANPLRVYPKVIMHYSGPNVNETLKKNQKKEIGEFIKMVNSNKYYSFKGEILCNDDSVYFFYVYKNLTAGFFYSAKSHKMVGGPLVSSLENTDTASIDEFRYPVTTYNEYFVSLLSPEDFGHHKWISSEELSAVKNNLKPTDNPVLVFFKLKDL